MNLKTLYSIKNQSDTKVLTNKNKCVRMKINKCKKGCVKINGK